MDRRDKPLRFSDHARLRMGQRGVSERDVEQAVRRASKVRPARRPDAKRFELQVSKSRRIVVIAAERPRWFWIVSVWWA